MIEFSRIAGFSWDDGNALKSAKKHGVSPSEAEQVFVNRPLIVTEDVRHSVQEARYHALGRSLDGRRLHVTFTLRENDTLIRVISARDMNRKERAIFSGASDGEEET